MTRNRAFLGIDIGTSSLKCSLYDMAGKEIATLSGSYPLIELGPGRMEIDAEVLWTSVAALVRKMTDADAGMHDVASVAVCAMMIMPVLLDGARSPLRPIIHWQDERLAQKILTLKKTEMERFILQSAGSLLTAESTISALLWVRENEPDTFRKLDRFVMTKDYIRLKLCGNLCTDYGDASGTLLLDVRNWKWSSELSERLGLQARLFPDLAPADAGAGFVTDAAAAVTGLRAGIPVATGTGDGICTILGLGALEHGDVGITVGSAGVIGVSSTKLPLDASCRNYIFCHPVRGKWYSLMATAASGDTLRWYRNSILRNPAVPYAELDKEAAAVAPGADGVIFLPYILGSRNPYSNPRAAGTFVGLRHKHDRGVLTRAVMEGILYEMLDLQRVEKEIIGNTLGKVRVSGGILRSRFWLRMLADMVGHELLLTEAQELGTLGCAVLASVAAGCHESIEAAVAKMVHVTNTVPSDPSLHARYQEKYQIFRRLYHDLEGVFEVLDI